MYDIEDVLFSHWQDLPMPVQTPDRAPTTLFDRRRAARRRPAQEDIVCRLSGIADENLGRGPVWNLSTTGISVVLNAKLEPGTLARAELVRPDGATLCRVLRVVHVTRLGTGDYVLGGHFSRPLDAAELRRFTA
jgi:hypothetical protein